jgi:hypothetical protein
MRNSLSIALLLVLAALAGYAVGAHPVEAQTVALPFSTGETVTISLQGGGSRKCRIEEIRGMFARCADPSPPQEFLSGYRQPIQVWVNAAVVEWVTKASERK